MGYGNAIGMKHIVDEGLDLDVALLWHLTSNHFPPIPEAMIPVARKAIEHASANEWDEQIDFPAGWVVNDASQMSVRRIVEIMHLDAFIDVDEIYLN